MAIQLTHDELRAHRHEQLEFLKLSCASFDRGFEGEAKRLATTVRVLVHDTTKSVSVLTHLAEKTGTLFVDTAIPFDQTSLMTYAGLVRTALMMRGPPKLFPILDERANPPSVSFDDWWDGVVLVDTSRNGFSRKDVVLTLANKLGGAHVDSRLDESFKALQTDGLGWVSVDPQGAHAPFGDHVAPTMRQIAHELIKTLQPEYRCELEVDGVGIWMMGATINVGGAPAALTAAPSHPPPTIKGRKVGRNDPCTCGSGKKYKHCCLK